jgi:hypothetical protein
MHAAGDQRWKKSKRERARLNTSDFWRGGSGTVAPVAFVG